MTPEEKIKQMEKGCGKVWFGTNSKGEIDQLEHICGYDILCKECYKDLENYKQGLSDGKEEVLDVLKELKDYSIDTVCNFFDRKINITEAQEDIKYKYEELKASLREAEVSNETKQQLGGKE